MKIVILYSGGLDSLIMRGYAQIKYPEAEIKCLYYKHGADSEEKEISTLPSYVEVRTVDWLNDKIRPLPKKSDPYAGAIYIPGRNMVFATLAACQELPDEIWMGTLADENNKQATDKNDEFLFRLNRTLQYVLSPFSDSIKVRFPFVEERWTKLDAVEWAKNYFFEEEIRNTVSCWNYETKPCGRCKQCFKRFLIFSLAGIKIDDYKIHPLETEEGRILLREYFNNHPQNEDELNVQNMIIECLNRDLIQEKYLEGLVDEA